MKSEKYELLDLGYSEKNKYSEKELSFFKEAWIKVQDDAYVIEDNFEASALLKKSFERLVLEQRVKLIQEDANLLLWFIDKRDIYQYEDKLYDFERGVQSIYAMIRNHDPRIKLDCFGDIEDNFKVLERAVLSMVNEYNTKFKDIEQKVKKATTSLFYNVLQVNRITGLQLNAMTMVIAEWLEAKKIALEINKSNTEKNERLSK
jgi:hypothetical protein